MGTLAVRQFLNLPDYRSKTQLSKQVRQALESTRNDMPDLEVSGTELQDLTNTVIETETAVKSLETSLTDWVHTDTQTEGLTLRELQGLDKALQLSRGELTNNLSKLTELDKDITRRKQKLLEAEDETSKRDIRSRIQNLEDERAARLEAASANKVAGPDKQNKGNYIQSPERRHHSQGKSEDIVQRARHNNC